jgi:hypothetical protein
MKHKVKVVRLPTVKESQIFKSIERELMFFDTPKSPKWGTNQYVYVTVSQDREPIKEGDYTIFRNKVIKLTADDIHPSMIERCKGKIIATTDHKLKIADFPELRNTAYRSLPRLQQSFLKEFVANPDGDFEVEYEKLCTQTGMPCGMQCLSEEVCNENSTLKLNQDNTVNITSVEEKERGITITSVKEKMYNREEVEILLKNISMESYIHGLKIGSRQEAITRDSWNAIDWIKENL